MCTAYWIWMLIIVKLCLRRCGCNQQPQKKTPVDGLLGLGMGRVGFVRQLKAHNLITKDIIGHCLSIDGGGYLFVGEHHLPDHITWVPMRKYR